MFGANALESRRYQSEKEILRCSHCNHSVDSDEVILTRVSLMKNPPDILFTTTEMLNQHLGNNQTNHLFGVGIDVTPPPVVLLDEVHTYVGIPVHRRPIYCDAGCNLRAATLILLGFRQR